MRMDLRYFGRSEVRASSSGGLALSFAPNLARPKVYYDGQVIHPLRFREAVSALHDVVVGDLRFKKKDKTAYRQWKEDQLRRESQLRQMVFDEAKKAELQALASEPVPAGLEQDFRKMHGLYWTRAPEVGGRAAPERPGAVPPPGALRPGGHGGARRGLLRVLLQGRVELRLPDGGPRRLPRRDGVRGSAPPTSTTRWPSTTTSRRCAPTARPACWWTPRASR